MVANNSSVDEKGETERHLMGGEPHQGGGRKRQEEWSKKK